MEVATTISHAGLVAEIYQDMDPISPRDADTLGVLAFEEHAEHECGLSDIGVAYLDFDSLYIECPTCGGSGEGPIASEQDCEKCNGSGEIEASIEEFFKSEHDAAIVIPISFADYRSNGSRVYESDNPNGVIFITKAKMADEALTVKQGRKCLEIEIEELDCWLQGEVWGYVIKNEDGTEIEPPQFVDSCWGFVARFEKGESWDYLLDESRNACEGVREQLDQEAKEQAEWSARDTITKGAS